MPLRQYQIDLIQSVRQAYRDGKKAPCIVLPCGGGKSVIVADIAKRTTDKGNRVLFLVHRKELCDQIRDTFTRWGVNMELCSIGMVQTFTRHIDRLEPPTLIITDENHHSLAASYKRIYEAFPNAYRIGVTATPVRLDGSGLADVNDALVIGVTVKWLIDHQYLSPYDYYSPSVADMSKVRTVRGEYDAKSAADTLMSRTIYGDVISHYKKLIRSYFGVDTDIEVGSGASTARGLKGAKAKEYIIRIEPENNSEMILREMGILIVREGMNTLSDGIYDGLIKTKCCRKAYLRGAFLGAGTINNPEVSHHFEINTSSELCARELRRMINTFVDINARIVERKTGYGVYLKARDQIADMLAGRLEIFPILVLISRSTWKRAR